MNISGERILVVEDESIIAIEVEQVLMDAGAASVTIAGRSDHPTLQIGGESDFTAAVIETRLQGEPTADLAKRLSAAGVAVVVGTAFDEYRYGYPDLPGAPVVMKPYPVNDIVNALSAAILAIRGGVQKPPDRSGGSEPTAQM